MKRLIDIRPGDVEIRRSGPECVFLAWYWIEQERAVCARATSGEDVRSEIESMALIRELRHHELGELHETLLKVRGQLQDYSVGLEVIRTLDEAIKAVEP